MALKSAQKSASDPFQAAILQLLIKFARVYALCVCVCLGVIISRHSGSRSSQKNAFLALASKFHVFFFPFLIRNLKLSPVPSELTLLTEAKGYAKSSLSVCLSTSTQETCLI